MAKSPRGLGRGYDALISTTVPGSAAARREEEQAPPVAAPPPDAPPDDHVVHDVPIGDIVPSPWQPRTTFDEEEIEGLARSIEHQGLLQPLGVRRTRGASPEGRPVYELVMGERRFRALKKLGRPTAPVLVMDLVGPKVREAALTENLQRKGLNPIEVAVAYQALIDENGYTHDTVADRMGLSRSTVTSTLGLLTLPDEIRRYVAEGQLKYTHARPLLGLPDAASQLRVARRAVKERLTVPQIKGLIDHALARPAASRRRPDGPSATGETVPVAASADAVAVRDLGERLQRHFGARARVEDKDGRGRIVIEYDAPDDAARILRLMGIDPE